jgi:hypothetical protein
MSGGLDNGCDSVPAGSVIGHSRRASTWRRAPSPNATSACVDTWLTDFRADLPKPDEVNAALLELLAS